MRPKRIRRAFTIAIALAALAFGAVGAHAQSYPAKPVRLVVGVPAGSGADLSARSVAEGLAQELGANVYVDNRPGGEGVIAVGQVTAAPPDGHTLLFGLGSQLAINPVTIANLPYDPQRDLVPVAMIALQPLIVAVHPAVPATTIAELVEHTKRHRGTVNYGTGTSTFMLAAESLKQRTGADMQHIPFAGAGQALNALIAGTVQVAVAPVPGTLAAAQGGRVRVLAITGTRRLPQLPDVPTFTEAGLVEDVPVWTALFAPAGTPNAVVDALHGALVRTFASPVARERALQLGNIPAVGTPDELRATIARDIARVDALARRLGLTAR